MTYSEISITFNIDFEIGYKVTIIRKLNDVNTSQDWEWVATRAAAFEVTTGTPTATEGERAAINFKAAFDLDNPSGFETTQTSNTVVIKSETEGEDFIGFKSAGTVRFTNGVEYTVVFENETEPIDITNVNLALVRSPHYVSTNFNFDTTTKATIDVTIWNGNLETVPTTPTYTLTRIRPTSDAFDLDTNLSEIIRSSLAPKVPTFAFGNAEQLINSDSNSIKWVEYVASFTDNINDIPDVTDKFGALDGYGYHSENANPGKPENRILLSNIENRQIARNGIILVPFVADGFIEKIIVSGTGREFNLIDSTISDGFVKYVVIDTSQFPSSKFIDIEFQYFNSFVMVVKSDNSGSSLTDQFTIPTLGTGYLYDVSTDDGYTATGITGNHTITFPSGAGTHEVTITGDFPKCYFNFGGDRLKLLEVTNWGTYGIAQPDQTGAFFNCANLTKIAGEGAWFDIVTNGLGMFQLCDLTSLPSGMTLPLLTNGTQMFESNPLTLLPEGMSLPLLTNGTQMFKFCNLTSLPEYMRLPLLSNGSQIFNGNTINTERYSQLLIDLESGNANNNVTFHGGNSKYNAAGEIARNILTSSPRNWTITDGGLE